MWGEMMTTRARILGAVGAVVNGYARDTRAVLKMGFPVFAFGSFGQDSGPRYKVYDYRVPVEVGQARIEPGDILFGDIDGVCVIPARAEVEVFSLALEKARGERLVKKDLEEGVSAVSAFERHGIM
jgi:regulator of RNase E activity RraA